MRLLKIDSTVHALWKEEPYRSKKSMKTVCLSFTETRKIIYIFALSEQSQLYWKSSELVPNEANVSKRTLLK